MNRHVFLQITIKIKSFATDGATIGLFPCMNQHVFLQIIPLNKAFVANCATIWPFSCMSHHVYLQISITANDLATNHTTKGIPIVTFNGCYLF